VCVCSPARQPGHVSERAKAPTNLRLCMLLSLIPTYYGIRYSP